MCGNEDGDRDPWTRREVEGKMDEAVRLAIRVLRVCERKRVEF